MNRMSTPWGVADQVRVIDPNRKIILVSTSSHGGYGVAHDLALPQHLNALGWSCDANDWRWFEEDQCWCAIPLAFPQFFSAATRASAEDTLRNYFPAAYEAHFGVKLTAAQSRAVERAEWEERTRDKFVVTSGFGSWAWNVPQGYVYATGWRRSDEATAGFLVPAAEYDVDPGRLVLDSYPRWEPDRSLPYSKPPRQSAEALA